jgi:phenylalanyl-tRNA synthetase beta chain
LSNPVSMQEGYLRTDMLPGLLRRVEFNFARGQRDVRLFELGTVFRSQGPGEAPIEETHLGLVVTGDQAPLHWKKEGEGVDLWYMKGMLGRIIPEARLDGASLLERAPQEGSLVPEEGFTVNGADGRTLGFAGRVEGSWVDAPAWAGPVWGLELTLPPEPRSRAVPLFDPPPAFPGVDRDLALLLPKGTPARQVETVIRGAAGPLLVELRIFDLYEGKGIAKDLRSVAFRLRFQSHQRTLKDEDVERSIRAVVDRLREELGVETRK